MRHSVHFTPCLQLALRQCTMLCWVDRVLSLSLSSLSTARLAAGQPKHLLFEVQPGSDATALWKVAVRVLCTKVRPESLLHLHTYPSSRWLGSQREWRKDAGGGNKPVLCISGRLKKCSQGWFQSVFVRHECLFLFYWQISKNIIRKAMLENYC